jgi:hypothetical protein
MVAPPFAHADAPRAALRADAGPVVASAAGARARAACVPLLRWKGRGELHQVVRCTVEGASGPARVALLDGGGTELAAGELGGGTGWLDLLVPAVERPARLALELRAQGEAARGEVEVVPQRRWEVDLVHHSHLDIGYTDPQGEVLRHQLEYLDAALDLVEATDDWPDDARFRWTVEVALPLRRWLAVRPARERDALLRRVAERRVEVCAMPFTLHTEACSLDELARTLHFAQDLRERHGIEVVTAMQTDVPGAAVALPELLSAAGVRYLSVAHNYAGRSVPFLHGGEELSRPFWWRAASGRRVLVWMTDSPHGIAYMEGNVVGLADDYPVALELLPRYLSALASRPYPYPPGSGWLLGLPDGHVPSRAPYPHDLLHLRVQSTIADNAPPSVHPAEIVREWNEAWAWPRLRLATNRDFFEAAENRLGDRLDTYEGDWTDWWADGIGSGARPLGRSRRAQARLRDAQTLHALSDTAGDGAPAGWREEVGRAYESLALFDEHTWGAANPWTDGEDRMDSGVRQWATKSAFADDAHERTLDLLAGARARLSARLPRPAGALAGLAAWNAAGTVRSDVVRAFLPASRVPLEIPLAVRDLATGELVRHAEALQRHAAHRPAGRWLSLLAHDVPACGCRVYAVVRGDGPAPEDASPAGDVLETAAFRVRLDPETGTVASLVHRGTGRELVAQDAPFGFGQYVHERYALAAGFNHLSGRLEGRVGPWLLGDRSVGGDGLIVARGSDAVEERVTVRLRGAGADWLETTVRLPHGVDRAELSVTVAKRPLAAKESVHVAFPFAVQAPEVEWELCGGVGGPNAPQVPGSARHMRAIRHWLTLRDAAGTVAWASRDAALVQVGQLHAPYAPFPPTLAAGDAGEGTVFSWAMNNVWDTNFPSAQGGETTFAYAVAGGGPGERSRALGRACAEGLTRPLVGVVSSPRAAGAEAAAGPVCEIEHPDVELVAVGPARAGGLALHLHSHAREPLTTRVRFGDRDGPVTLAPGEYVALPLEGMA